MYTRSNDTFAILASKDALALEKGYTLRVELQEGVAGKPHELVIARYAPKSEKPYSQVRFDCTKENVDALNKAMAYVLGESPKHPKAAAVDASALDVTKLDADGRAALVKFLLAQDAAEKAATKKPTASKTPELVLENKLSNKGKRR
jgi:hypothetical protein